MRNPTSAMICSIVLFHQRDLLIIGITVVIVRCRSSSSSGSDAASACVRQGADCLFLDMARASSLSEWTFRPSRGSSITRCSHFQFHIVAWPGGCAGRLRSYPAVYMRTLKRDVEFFPRCSTCCTTPGSSPASDVRCRCSGRMPTRSCRGHGQTVQCGRGIGLPSTRQDQASALALSLEQVDWWIAHEFQLWRDSRDRHR